MDKIYCEVSINAPTDKCANKICSTLLDKKLISGAAIKLSLGK